MMARLIPISFLSLGLVAGISTASRSETQIPSDSAFLGNQVRTLSCEPVSVTSSEFRQTLCRPASTYSRFGLPQTSEERKRAGEKILLDSYALHVTRNLATEDMTTKFVKGLVGESVAEKVAPTVFRVLKSTPSRYGIIAAGAIGGTIYLYEQVFGGSGSSEETQSSGSTFTLRAIIDRDGKPQQIP